MVRVSLSVEDVKQVVDGLEDIAKEIPQAIEAALLEAADEAMEVAKQACPVDTGALQDSIEILEKGDNFVVIGTDLEYAVYVEFGTHKMQAQPYIGPAADAMESRFVQIFAEELESRLS